MELTMRELFNEKVEELQKARIKKALIEGCKNEVLVNLLDAKKYLDLWVVMVQNRPTVMHRIGQGIGQVNVIDLFYQENKDPFARISSKGTLYKRVSPPYILPPEVKVIRGLREEEIERVLKLLEKSVSKAFYPQVVVVPSNYFLFQYKIGGGYKDDPIVEMEVIKAKCFEEALKKLKKNLLRTRKENSFRDFLVYFNYHWRRIKTGCFDYIFNWQIDQIQFILEN